MPVHCQDCNHHFLLDGSTVAQGISCPGCGGTQLERDQPSPTHSDGELRDMVDPATQLDQGGNPLQEGVWAGVDGGWQPAYKRDESFASVQSTSHPVMSSHNPEYYISMEPHMPWTHEATTKESIAPLVLMGGRLLLGQALGGLMRKAINGVGNTMPAPQQDPYGRPVGLVASERTAVGVDAPVESPDSVPHLDDSHDPEAVDQQEFNDGDLSPAFNNPNLDGADAGLSQSTGEDGMKQKLEFAHDSDSVGHAEMLLPLIMEYVNSDKSAMDNPQLKALHEQLDREIPDYLNLADENDPKVHEFLESLKRDHGVEARTAGWPEVLETGAGVAGGMTPLLAPWLSDKYDEFTRRRRMEQIRQLKNQWAQEDQPLDPRQGAPVYQNTPMAPGQMQMGPQQQMMPGTHQNPVGPGGMSVQGKCMNCGGVTNADGSCPQCGASSGVNQQGNLEQPGQQHLQTPGIMPSPYARQATIPVLPEMEAPPCPHCQGVPGNINCPTCFGAGVVRHDEGSHAPGTMEHMPDEWRHFGPDMGEKPWGVLPIRQGADHQGPITPQQQQVFAQHLIEQGRNDEVAAMMGNPALYADEWAQYLNRSTQPPEVDPTQQAPQPQMDPAQMGQMPVPGMSVPPPTGPVASTRTAESQRRCPKCQSATTTLMNTDGDMRCHRCQNIWSTEGVHEKMGNWIIKSFQDNLNDSPNPVAAPAADATAPGDREQQADSTLTWQAADGTPLQVGQTYEMHNPGYAIPDVVKIQAVKPDAITVTMEGEYNSPSDPQDQNGPGYTHEITQQELQTEGLTFNPVQGGEGDAEQSQDQNDQDGIGQTVNTEPVQQNPEVPYHAAVQELPTDHCPKCSYGHVTSSYLSADLVQYECYRCAHAWKVADENVGVDEDEASRAWLNESSIEDDIGFDPRALAMASSGQGRNIQDIAKRDPRLQQIHDRLEANKTAGAKFSPNQQKQFIDEDGVARNADRLNLDGTHYVSSGYDNSKARPDRVNDNYIGLGL